MEAVSTTKVDFSSIESGILNLQIGRCNADAFDEKELYQQIAENHFDLCRLKIPAEDELASLRLNNMGLPFYFSGSIRRYKTKIAEPPAGNYNHPDLVWELYDGSQTQLLRDMLVGTWGTYPLGYYRTPYINHLVTKELEIEAVFQFYKKHNLTKDYPDNSIVFIKQGENYVGFFALNIINGNLESHIGGILEPYRKGGYFLDKLRYIKEYCIQHRLPHFIFGARNENAEVQRIFQHVGFQPRGSENVFHIPSLLTFSKTPAVEKEINVEANASKMYQQLLNECELLAVSRIGSGRNISFKLNNVSCLPAKKARVRFSFPVSTPDELLIVLTCTEDKANLFTGYYTRQK